MIIRISTLLLTLCAALTTVRAQVFDTVPDSIRPSATETTAGRVIVADGFMRHWFVQMGLDMTLQNPYGYDFSKVFPNGKTFGLDLAVGKWFSHQVGVRGHFNWENALPLLENGHADWLAPFGQRGENRRRGGYVAAYGDVLLNVHNLFLPYRADRTWNLSVYPRAGFNYNFGVTKGALAAGAGVLNTYRVSRRWSVYGDVAYVMTGSGFVGTERVEGTGTGSNSNGYLTIGVGAQCDLDAAPRRSPTPTVLAAGLRDGWFVQMGADMSLMNPYGCNFSQVIPKGLTVGLNGAVGKWFTPELALRGRLQWDNGLVPNRGVEWLAPADAPAQNYRKGGLAVVSLDALLNVTTVALGYEPTRRWHTSAYLRMGVITQFAVHSASPLFGAGIEETCRLNGRLSLFGAVGYQVSTSEGMGYGHTGMQVAAGTNGFFDLDFGVRLDIPSPQRQH